MLTLRTIHLSPRPMPSALRRASHHASRALGMLMAAACMTLAGPASAQLFQNKDWVESPVPPAPAFSESRLIPIEMPTYLSLRFGIDPATIVITGDGVVRYVVVASNKAGGATNAFYEGIRCATGEMKTYARSNGGAWEVAEQPEWKIFKLQSSTHTSALASQAICRGSAPRDSIKDMMSRLRNPVRELD